MADSDISPDKTDEKSQSLQEAQEKVESIRRFLGDNTLDTPPKDETKAPAKEAVPEAEAEAETPETPTPPGLTQDQVDQQIVQAKEQVLSRIKESFGLTESEQEEMAEAGVVAPWEKENRAPASWKEVTEYAAELAEFKRKQTETENLKIQEEKAKQTNQAHQQMNQVWDMQLDELRETGKIPKIAPAIVKKLKEGQTLTEDERKDPGLATQAELFQTMYVISRERQAANKPAVTNIKEVFYEYYKPQKRDSVAGAEAPVSGGSQGVDTPKEEVDYKEIHNSDWYDLLNEE